jgi:hypothetical protein
MRGQFVLAAAATAALAGCTTYGDGYGRGGYEDYRYEGRDYSRGRGNPFRGPGAHLLDPWLAETREGQRLVRMGWPGSRDGRIGVDLAHRANLWFRRYADSDRDLCLTDAEIRIALVMAAHGPRRFARR